MYLELLIFPAALDGLRIYNETARGTVAKACDGYAVDPRLFARGTDGKTLSAIYPGAEGKDIAKPPLVAFGGGKGLIRLTGLGAEGVQVLRDNAQMVCAALGAHYPGGFRFKLNEGHCEIEQLHGHVKSYFIPKMLLSKKLNTFKRLSKPGERISLDEVRPMVIEQIKAGLIGQARYMDESYRAEGHPARANLESSLGTDDMLNIEVHEGGPNFQSFKPGDQTKGLFVNDLLVTMALDVSGPWYVGGLRSRGTGQILRSFVQ